MCRLCDEGFDQIHVLRQHSVCHADPVTGTYACPWCHKTFDMYGTARRHARAFHSQTHSCPDCGKTFPRPDKLKLHRLRHSTHREFMCENCGRQFKRKVGSALRFFTRSRFATFRESPGKCGNIREFRSGGGDVSARSAQRSVFSHARGSPFFGNFWETWKCRGIPQRSGKCQSKVGLRLPVFGSVTITTESSTDGATTMSRVNFSGHVGHATIFSRMCTTACCLVVELG